ncbi:unnamed protein product [Boreogadus saida]
MATQVEALLPNNPLVKQEEHGHAGNMLHDEVCSEAGAKRRSTDVAGSRSRTDDPEQDTADNEETPKQGTEESHSQGKDSLTSDQMVFNNLTEDSSKGNPKEFTEAPPPKVNPWTKKMNAVTVVNVNGQAHEPTGPAKVVRAGNPPRPRRGGKVGDFGDANNWPTPGEIATKDTQVGFSRFEHWLAVKASAADDTAGPIICHS